MTMGKQITEIKEVAKVTACTGMHEAAIYVRSLHEHWAERSSSQNCMTISY